MGLAYRIEETILTTVDEVNVVSSRVVFESDHVAMSADDVMQNQRGWQSPERDKAEEWLEGLLSGGPMKQADVEQAIEGSFHTTRTVRRAADKLGVIKEKEKGKMDGKWLWRLPSNHS
jgi:hypothetical protein